MRNHWRVVTFVVAVLAATPWVEAAASPHEAAWFWAWSDGSAARERTFTERAYADQSHLPALIVATDPATSGRAVVLQYLDGRGWHDDDAATTNARGRVRLELNPYCADGDWCRRAYRYRVVAGGSTTSFTVTFAR
jgi:hypothetical protein